MSSALPAQGVLQVVPPATLEASLRAQDEQRAAAQAPETTAATELARYIRTQYETFRRHRSDAAAGWNERLLAAMRAFNRQYDAAKLSEIKKFGGSEVYAGIIAMKCRGASSLLRDVYLAPERPWGLAPPDDPDIPPQILESIKALLMSEVSTLASAGQEVDPGTIRDRAEQLTLAAREAARKRAKIQADIAEDKINEILVEGGFYRALAEFLVDLPLFPFACIKGPVVRIVPEVDWSSGRPTISQKPRMFWNRTSPFDLWFTPGVSEIEDAEVIERLRLTRADLNDLLDLPGYNVEEVRKVLEEYGRGGLNDNWDETDSERATAERRENPTLNRSGLISCLEYHGNVQGTLLLEHGIDASLIEDPVRDYAVQAWLIGNHIIKVQLTPSPRKRHPYFITSFEKVPGTPVGNALPDVLGDIADVANATLRSLVNNLSISSGPQVMINDDRLAPGEDGEDLYPWKRWHTVSDPMGNSQQVAISFFQPTSNANELLSVYQKMNDLADDLSAIPRYISGQSPGGAGRTASGLAMLMANASKILQTVAANVDRDVIEPVLSNLFDVLMLTDASGLLTGEESIRVLGVNVAIQRETERSRQIEFLQVTANPIDAQIMGPNGRAAVLRSVSKTIGLDGEEVVPNPGQMHPQMAQPAADAQGEQSGPAATGDMGPRTNIVAGGAG